MVARVAWLPVLCALLLAAGCDCGGKKPDPATVCTGVGNGQPGRGAACGADADCADHFVCRPVAARGASCCVFADRACATEADCCPGQVCNPDRQRCFDQRTECTADAECGPDRTCQTYTDHYGTSRRCRLRPCGPGGSCPAGQACFQGECLTGLPCDGACAPGRACVASLGRCQAAACPASCAPGFLATFNDGANLWDRCELPKVRCECAELPGLPASGVGRDSALALLPGQGLFVSAYDARYGDLVVAEYDLDGGLRRLSSVDGVPAAAPRYGPSGYRGGVVEPGPDVGRHTSAAAAGGRVYVSYQDVDHRELAVAVRDPSGAWRTHRVDGATGDVGRFTSLAVDGAGRPAVAYFQRSAEAGFDLASCPPPRPQGPLARVTALKLARATTAAPASAADWTVQVLACLDAPAPAALAEVPPGVGAFPSLAFRGEQALVAAMRRAPRPDGGAPVGALVGVAVSGAGAVGPLVVLDATGDTGFFPSLQVEPGSGRLGISYHDAASRSLRFWLAPDFQTGVAPELVDDGHQGPGVLASVGPDSALVLEGGGAALVAYQDASHGDLRLARRGPGGWAVLGPLASAGAVGFFAHAVQGPGVVYVSHARLGTRPAPGGPVEDDALLLELVR